MLFEADCVPSAASLPNYDVSSDGQRFLMLKPGDQTQTVTQINVVTNWVEELKRRVPLKQGPGSLPGLPPEGHGWSAYERAPLLRKRAQHEGQ